MKRYFWHSTNGIWQSLCFACLPFIFEQIIKFIVLIVIPLVAIKIKEEKNVLTVERNE